MSEPLRREVQIFNAALEMSSEAERAAYVAHACAGDDELLHKVEALLRAHAGAEEFFRAPGASPGAGGTVRISVPLTEKPGDKIGHYKLLQEIGEGGCGVVYVAEQAEPIRRRVALKVIKLGMDTRQVVARFEAERQALALMDHPNIAKVLDAGATETGRPYFVMELVRGSRITDYCDQNRLPTAQRLDLFIQVSHAIQHAHQKGVIHRDIKPSNILVTVVDGQPVPKVIDFGIAKAIGQQLTDKTVYTAFEQFIGTPAYMSPEQAQLSGVDVDTRSDIYSLGVLLYELLTGRTPFDPKTLVAAGLDEMRRVIRETEPPKPSTRLSTLDESERTTVAKYRQEEPGALRRLVRGDLDWIVMKCLEKDRNRRYETANALGMDLRRHIDHEPVNARPPSPGYRLQKLVRRNRLAFASAAAFLAVLLLGTLVSSWQAIRANRNAQRARKAAAELEHNLYAADIYLAQNAIKEGNYGLAKNALRGHLPREGAPDARGFEWSYFWTLCQGDKLASWHAHSNVIVSVAVSPTGKWVASAGWDHQALVWDAADHTLLASLADADCVAFSQDGDWLFTASTAGRVRAVPTGTWGPEVTVQTGDVWTDRPAARIAVSPASPVLAVCTGGGFFSGRGTTILYQYLARSPASEGRDEATARGPRVSVIFREIGRLADSGDRMQFSADGKWLVTGSAEGKIKVWNVATRELVRTLGPVGGLSSLALSPDGRLLATTEFWDFRVRLWDLVEGRELTPLAGHTALVWCAAFSPDGQTLASSSSDQTIRLWDLSGRKEVAKFLGHESEIWTLAFAPNGKFLCSGSKDETVALWPTRPVKPADTIPHVVRRPEAVTLFSPNGRMLGAPDAQGGILLADTATANIISTLPLEKTALWFAPDSRALLTLGTNDALHTWDLPGLTLRRSVNLAPKPAPISRALVSGDGRLLATISERAAGIQVWETSSGILKHNLRSRGERALDLALSADARRLAAVGDLGPEGGDLIEIWDLANPDTSLVFGGHKDGISMIAFSPDGDTLASASVDNTIKLWSLSRQCEIATLRGHREGVMGVAFSPDGKTLASASGDRSCKLWNLPTRREIAWFRHTIGLLWAGFSPDGRCFGYRCDHGQIMLLRCPSVADIDAELKLAQRKEAKPEHNASDSGS